MLTHQILNFTGTISSLSNIAHTVICKIDTFGCGTNSREIQLKSTLQQFCHRVSIYERAVLGVVILSVRPFVTRVDCC